MLRSAGKLVRHQFALNKVTPGNPKPTLTAGFLMAKQEEDKVDLLRAIKPHLVKGVDGSKDLLPGNPRSLQFYSMIGPTPPVTDKILPLVTDDLPKKSDFDIEQYTDHLNTSTLGNVVMYTKVANTTMDFLEPHINFVPENVGLIAVASIQLHGEAASDDTFLSPKGTMMFSLDVRVPETSFLGHNPDFFQYIGCLAMQTAVTDLPGYKDVDLHIMWPQEIYFGRANYTGGVLVTLMRHEGTLHANVGCGLYIEVAPETDDNTFTCLSDIIQQYNEDNETSLVTPTVEEIMGRTVTNIGRNVDLFKKEGGNQEFVRQYNKKLLLRNNPVQSETSGKKVTGTIVGLDDAGSLKIKEDNGSSVSFKPTEVKQLHLGDVVIQATNE